MSQADIAIVVVAFNRFYALDRLLTSLSKADYSSYQNISLIISIDFSGTDDCYSVADAFIWTYGEKKIITHPTNQGLKSHILQCGDLSKNHEAIIVLEDDLFVSPAFYDYAQQAFTFYKDDERIAGMGLYNYRFNELALCPFEPVWDSYDNYFLQVPCSCGQMWTQKQWLLFRNYLSAEMPEGLMIPQAVESWPSATSWKKMFFNYQVSFNRYFVYPRISLTTNFGDIGQHFDESVLVWQTALLMKYKMFNFSQLNQSLAVYDTFFELEAKTFNKLSNTNLDVCLDLNGSKPLAKISNEYLISARKCKRPIKKYALNLYPYENNVVMGLDDENIIGNYISLGKTKDFKDELNVDRLSADIRRIFFDKSTLTAIGRNEAYRSKEYKLGASFLRPFLFVKRILKIKG